MLEVAHPAGESASPQPATGATTASHHLNSEAVSLDVPVKVYGSRVTDVARGTTPRSEPFEEETTTMIVFPEGGVLKMSTVVNVGQMLVLANLKSRQEAICRIVKVRAYSSSASYVEVEFTNSQPGYWGVYFPSDGPELAKKVVSLALPLTQPAEANEWPLPALASTPATVPSLPTTKAPDPNPPSGQPKQIPALGSSFISIGSQEDVQAAASTTSFTRVAPSCGDAEVVSVAATAPAKQATEESPARDVHNTFGVVSADGLLSGRYGLRTVRPADMESPAARNSKPRQHERRIAATAALLVVVLGGGVFWFNYRSAGHGTANSAPGAAAEPPATSAPQHVVSQAAQSISGSSPVDELKPASEPPIPPSAKAASVSKDRKASAFEPSAPVKQSAPNVTSDLFGTLNAHPVSSRHEDAPHADIPPTFDAGTVSLSGDSALAGIGSIPVIAPPPPLESNPNSHGPLSIGGQVKEPRLLSSPMPVYPMVARQTHTEGDVVLSTVIDQTGKVADMKVVSGPAVLRQAAVDALRNWKYEPSKLDGQSVSVHLLVTLRFRFASNPPTR